MSPHSSDENLLKNTIISQPLKLSVDTHSRQGMNINLLGRCCHLPAVLQKMSTSCSFDYCRHCVYSGEADASKRAHGIGSCVWHLYGMTHIGAFEAGIPCGWGTRTWDDGVAHEGFWSGHKLNG